MERVVTGGGNFGGIAQKIYGRCMTKLVEANGHIRVKPGTAYLLGSGLVMMGVWTGIQQNEIKHLKEDLREIRISVGLSNKVEALLLEIQRERLEKRGR